MAARILACLMVLAAISPATESAGWRYYPVASDFIESGKIVRTESGLKFYFNDPSADRATITGTVIDCGKEHPIAGEIDTDSQHGDTILHFAIGNLDRFEVKRMTVTIGGRSSTVTEPHIGTYYR